MPTIRRLAYSAVSTARPLPPGEAEDASTTLNDGRTNGVLEAGWAAVQSRMPDAERTDLQQLGPVGAQGAGGQHLEVEAVVGLPVDEDGAGEHTVADLFGRRGRVRARLEVELPHARIPARERRVERAVHDRHGPRGQRRVVGDDANLRHGGPIEEPDAKRDQRDHHGQSDQQQRREHECPGPHALDVLTAGDEPDVGAVRALGHGLGRRGRHGVRAAGHAASSAAAAGDVAAGASAPSVAASSPSTGARWVSWSAGWPT